MNIENIVITISAIVIVLVIIFAKIRKYVPQSIFRKIVHLSMGLVFVKIIPILFGHCDYYAVILPLVFLVAYCFVLIFAPSVAQIIGRSSNTHAIGIIEYILLFCLYPLCKCNKEVGLSLMCLLGGDGLAGMASYVKWRKGTIINREKSYIGSLLCVVGSLAYMYIYDRKIHVDLAVIASIAEALPIDSHDNLVVTLVPLAYQYYPQHTTVFVIFSVILAIFYRLRKFTKAGAIAGVAVVFAHYLVSTRAFVAVAVFGVLGTLSSTLKKIVLKRKAQANDDAPAEQRLGRSAHQVVQNSAVSIAFCAAFYFTDNGLMELAAVAASAECLADTWASDIGVAYSTKAVSCFSFRECPRGMNGGVSAVGSLAGLAGAAAIAFATYSFRNVGLMLKVAVAGCVGCWADSVLGLTLQATWVDKNGNIQQKKDEGCTNIGGYDVLSNGAVNVVASMVAGVVAVII